MKPVLLALCLSLSVQAQISAPRAGLVRYANGSVRSVYGVPGNLVVASSPLLTADAVSFSDFGGLISQNGKISLIRPDGSPVAVYDSAESAPILSVTGDLKTALAWLPNQHALLHWNGSEFSLREVNDAAFPGTIASLAANGTDRAQFLIVQPNGAVSRALVSLTTGALISCDVLPGVEGFALEQRAFIVFHDERGLEVQEPNGNLRKLPLAAKDIQFQRMSSDWFHLYSPSSQTHWALRLTGTDMNLSLLPPPPSAYGGAK